MSGQRSGSSDPAAERSGSERAGGEAPIASRDDVVLMRVADVRPLDAPDGTPTDRCQVVLREVDGARSIDLRFPRSVGEWTASALRGVEVPWGSSPYHHTLQHVKKSGHRVTAVLLAALKDGTLSARIKVSGRGGSREVAARPADSVTLALLAGAPIYATANLLVALESPKVERAEGSPTTEQKGSSELAIDLFERQEDWDPAIQELPPLSDLLGLQGWAVRTQVWGGGVDLDPAFRVPVDVEAVAQHAGPSWRSDALSPRLAERLDEEVTRIIEEHRLVGVAVGLAWGGELAYFASRGVRDASSLAPVTEHTAFPLISVTKTITSLAVMQLWERGLFGLDDPVDRYVKTVAVRPRDEHAVPVTIRRLLTHTHGLLNAGRVYMRLSGEPLPTVSEFLRGGLVAAGREDEPWKYGQDGFMLLGQLVEELSGRSFRDYVVEHIFEPLGMDESDVQGGPRLGEDRATGYERDLVGVYAFSAPLWTLIAPAIGLVVSTVRDLGRYAAALAGRMPANVLKSETLAAMFEPQVVVPVRWPAHFGLGFNLRTVEGALAVGQNGGASGSMTVLWAVPERDLGIIMCTNTSGSPGLEREPPETLLPLALAHC